MTDVIFNKSISNLSHIEIVFENQKKLFINNVLLHLTVMKIQETFSIQQTTMKKRKLIVSHLKITKTATDCNGNCY